MGVDRDDREERIARIDMLLEELRLNTDDLQVLTQEARARARQRLEEARAQLAETKAEKKTGRRVRRKPRIAR